MVAPCFPPRVVTSGGAASGGDPPRRVLPRRFFARDTVLVARELVGCTLWTERGGEVAAGRIVEVEAYLDERDPASHASRGMTARSRVMFGPPGVVYVYLIYGMHHCLNLVTEREDRAGAVLLRAIEPLVGIPEMCRRRGLEPVPDGMGEQAMIRKLCAGPGRLCRAMGVDLGWNGLPLLRKAAHGEARDGPARKSPSKQLPPPNRVWVSPGAGSPTVAAGPRIGISLAAGRPWRFYDPRSSCLSRPAVG